MSIASSSQVEQVVAAIRRATAGVCRPLTVALDGRSGAGKSTLAEAVRVELVDAAVIEGDSFYAGGTPAEWDRCTAEEKADRVIDWRRQRPVLEAVRAGRAGEWHGFDWLAFDGRLELEPTTVEAAAFVILEGAYSAPSSWFACPASPAPRARSTRRPDGSR